jgi:ribosomal protein S18 acetylase RimI-like enzyme
MGCSIRPAEAGDAEFIAWVMETAARSHLRRGFWHVLFPEEGPRRAMLEALAVHPAKCHCHHGGFLIAERDGEPVGALSGYEPFLKNEQRFQRAVVGSLVQLGAEEEQLDELELRVSPFMLCKPEFPEHCWVVEWVAVRPEARGRGVVDALLSAILDEGRARGYEQAQLAYMLGNERAEAVYRRHGFEVVAARTDPSMQAAVGSAGVGRMRVVL